MYKVICHALQCFAMSLDLNTMYSSKDKALLSRRRPILMSSAAVSQQCFTETWAPLLNEAPEN